MRILSLSFVTIIHVLVGAAWFGAMFYSLTVLHPRARAYFERVEDFESLIVHLSHGARWKVIGALAAIFASGVWLLIDKRELLASRWWGVLILTKTVLFVVATAVFVYTSWILWPKRIFAASEDLPRIHRTFRLVAFTL